jgi:hypothetical protein
MALIMRPEADTRPEDHPVHGWRLLALNTGPDGRRVFAVLLPVDESEGVWVLKTARFVS